MADLLPQRHNDLGQPSIDLIERTSKRCRGKPSYVAGVHLLPLRGDQ
jgi:hypothetical protein